MFDRQSRRAVSPGFIRHGQQKYRRTKWDVTQIKRAIVKVLKNDHPMTVRQVFYQLVVRGVIKKTEEQYKGTVIRLLTEMRMEDEIEFRWISDESRHGTELRSFDSVSEALDDTAKFYRRNAMRESAVYIEVWSEKQALSGIISDAALTYGVPIMVSKGMPSLTQLYETAVNVHNSYHAGKETYIYQFGDHDPSGVLIPKTIKTRLTQLCQKLDCPPPHFERASLTVEQIEAFDLPTRPTKREGNRHAKNFRGESVELDALPSAELRRIIREWIRRHISNQQWAALQAAEASERQLLYGWAESARDAAE